MANQFVALPAPAGNGPGTPVDVSTFGLFKTVTYLLPTDFFYKPTIIVEFSNELVPVHFAPLAVLGSPDEVVLTVAARWMRVTVASFRGGGAPIVSVGGDDLGTSFDTLVATPKSGTGAGVDVSALGAVKTIHVATAFKGVLNIEISEDAGTTYNQVCSFYGPGHKTLTFAADFMRATRGGVPSNAPGQPIINIGAVPDPELPPVDTKQVFRYAVTGLEPGNPFTVALPAARASANYNVQCTPAGPQANAFKDYRPLTTTFAVGQFNVECGAAPEVGDVLEFTVEDLT